MTLDEAPNPVHKIALIGLGNMGSNHYRVLSQNDDFEIVGAYDPGVKKLPLKYNTIPLVSSWDELIQRDFSAAIIAAPTEHHFKIADQLLDLKKDLLVEKPLSIKPEESENMIEKAKQNGVSLFVGHVERSNPAVRRLKEILDKGWIGDPIHFSFTRVGGYPQNIKEGNNVLLDLAVHDLDVLQYLCGDFEVRSSVCHNSFNSDIADTAEILLANGKGMSANVHVNWVTPTKIRSIRVTGSKGVVFVDYMLQTCVLHGGDLLQDRPQENFDYKDLQKHYRNTDKIEFGVAQEEPLKVQLNEWSKALRGKTCALATGLNGSKAVRLAEAALLASPK